MVKSYTISSIIVLFGLIITLFLPWIKIINNSYSMLGIILEGEDLYNAMKKDGEPFMIELPEEIYNFIWMILTSAVIYVLAIILAIIGSKNRLGLLAASASTLGSALLFLSAYEYYKTYISDLLGPMAFIIGDLVVLGIGPYIALLIGGLGIIGYLISHKID